MVKRLGRKEWLNRHKPGPKDRHVESAWLDEHWLYGGTIHEEAAAAIVAALSARTTRAVGHALYLKLFAEFANAMEVAGAWGWVIRTRRGHALLLDAFLTYNQDDPRSFYAAARRNRGSAVRLFDLPAESKVVEALAVIFPDATTEERRDSLATSVKQAKFLAARFFDGNELFPTIFNRAKHGATLMHDTSLSPREFWVVAPHFTLEHDDDRRRYLMPKFTLDRATIRNTEHGVKVASNLIQYLAGLARALNEAGLLYGARHRGR